MIKKSWSIGLGLLLVCFVTVGIISLSFSNKKENDLKYSAAYDKYAKEFNCIKDYVLEAFPDATDKWLGVSITDERGRGLYDSDVNALMERSDDIIAAMDAICDYGFPDSNAIFESVRIKNDSVYFCISNERYTLVYSPEDAPVWFDDSVENEDVLTEEIEDGWYHLAVVDK